MATTKTRHYYLLKLFVDSTDVELVNCYKQSMIKHNTVVERYLNLSHDRAEFVHMDAGFDLFCPELITVLGKETQKVNHKVKTAMEFISLENQVSLACGYYLYPRSSTGTKTPLRLANSVGIIDSGYRGNLIAVFDNWSQDAFTIEPYQRLMQVCPPNLTYPIYVRMVETEADLGLTIRGSGGFGSSGK
jgi:dUTP pyrophosphatase